MKVSIIAALNNLKVIGKNNALPWHLPEDLKHFKRLTLYTPIIMGRKTFESIDCKPLPKRLNIIVSSKLAPRDGIIVVKNIYEALQVAKEYAINNNSPRISVVGGEGIYREFLEKNLVNEAFLTRIDNDIEGDTFFPLELIEENPNWILISENQYKKDKKNPYNMNFQHWIYKN